MKKQTVVILVGGYIALSVASLIGSQMWMKKLLKNLEPDQIDIEIKEDEA